MATLKAPITQPKNETIQLRVSQELKFRLTRYAEFIHASTSYVVSEVLVRFFRKDADYQEYLATYKSPQPPEHGEEKPQAMHSDFASAAKK